MSDKNTPIFLSDLLFYMKLHKKKVMRFSLIFTSLLVFITLTYFPQYTSSAHFKLSDEGEGSNVDITYLIAPPKSLSEKPIPLTLLTTGKILYPTIEKLHLQAHLPPESRIKSSMKNIKDNLVTEYRTLLFKTHRPLYPNTSPLSVLDVSYKGKMKAVIHLHFLDDTSFVPTCKFFPLPEKGKLDEPLIFSKGSFTLTNPRKTPLKGKTLTLVLKTKERVVEEISKAITISQDSYDPNLLGLSFTHPRPEMAQQVLEEIMKSYKQYLFEEKEFKHQAQLGYLNQRFHQVNQDYIKELHSYADNIKTVVADGGYFDSNREIASLSNLKDESRKQLLKIENEMKRLREHKLDDFAYLDPSFNLEALKDLFHKKRRNQQRIYQLSAALPVTKTFIPNPSLREQYQDHIDLFEKQIAYFETMLQKLQEKAPLNLNIELVSIPELISQWITSYNQLLPKILSAQNEKALIPPEEMKVFYTIKNHLSQFFYENQNLLKVQAKNLSFRYNSQQDYLMDSAKGLEPEITESLIKKATDEFEGLEKELKKVGYILSQLQDSNFSINALSSVLNDPTSQDLIKKSSQLYLDLQDTSNFTQKESKRKKEHLKILKHSLSSHLQRLHNLLALEKNNIKNTLLHLQQITLERSQQQASIIEASIDNIIKNKIDSLEGERQVLLGHIQGLKNKMLATPNTWAQQKALEVKSEVNKHLLEEVSKLVEQKNVQGNLSLIDSKVINEPNLPFTPGYPLLILKSIFFFALSMSSCFLFFAYQLVTKGPLLHPSYLLASGKKYLGAFSSAVNAHFLSLAIIEKLKDEDIKIFRKIIQKFQGTQVIYTALNSGSNYLPFLCHLLYDSGTKALVIDFSPEKNLLLKQDPSDDIKDGLCYDWLTLSAEKYSLEKHLHTPSFQAFLSKAKSLYPLIIFSYSGKAQDPLSLSLHQLATLSCLTLQTIEVSEMEPFLKKNKTLFVTCD